MQYPGNPQPSNTKRANRVKPWLRTRTLAPLLLAASVSQAYAITVNTTGPDGLAGISGVGVGVMGAAGGAAMTWDAMATPLNDFHNEAFSQGGIGGQGGNGAAGDGTFLGGAAGAGGLGGSSTATAITLVGSANDAISNAQAIGGNGGASGQYGSSGGAGSGNGGNGGAGGNAWGSAQATSSNGSGFLTLTSLSIVGGSGGSAFGEGSRAGDGGQVSAGLVSATSTGGGDASASLYMRGGNGGDVSGWSSLYSANGGNGAAVMLTNAVSVSTTGTARFSMVAIGGNGGAGAGDGRTAGVAGTASITHVLNDTKANALVISDSATGGSGSSGSQPAIKSVGANGSTFANISGIGAINLAVKASGGNGGNGLAGFSYDGSAGGNASVTASAVTTHGPVTVSGVAQGGSGGASGWGSATGAGGTGAVSLYGASGDGGAVSVAGTLTNGAFGSPTRGYTTGNGLDAVLKNAVSGRTSGALTLSQTAVGGGGGYTYSRDGDSVGSFGSNGGTGHSELMLNDNLASSVTVQLTASGGFAGSLGSGGTGTGGAGQAVLNLTSIGQATGILSASAANSANNYTGPSPGANGGDADSSGRIVGAQAKLTVLARAGDGGYSNSSSVGGTGGAATAYGYGKAVSGDASSAVSATGGVAGHSQYGWTQNTPPATARTANATANAEVGLNGVASAEATARGFSGVALANSFAYGAGWQKVVTQAQASVNSNSVVSTAVASLNGSADGLTDLSGSMTPRNAFSKAAGVLTASDVSAAIANHANAMAATAGGTAKGLGSLGVMAAGDNSTTYSSSAEFTLNLGGNAAMSLNLLDGLATGADGYAALSFSVMSGSTTLLSRSFATQADASTYFHDQSILLGIFDAGYLDLTVSMSMTSATAGQGFAGSYLLSGVAVAVPEPGSWALMALGVAGLIGWRRRHQAEA